MNIIFKLPRLSRGWKTARNLTFAVLWLVFLWGLMDYPLYDQAREFRWAERAQWAGPSDIRWVGEHYHIVGTYLDQVIVQIAKDNLWYWPRNPEGPTLVPVEDNRVLAVDVPQGTVRAELSGEIVFYYRPGLSEAGGPGPTYANRDRAEEEYTNYGPVTRWRNRYATQGELLEEGGVLFTLRPNQPEDWDAYPLICFTAWETYHQSTWENWVMGEMEAVFYDETGGELARAALSTPEGGIDHAL